ncbi:MULTISPECIES: carbon-nitrogen hydrolase family protein [unclassified Ruegeria]|uniref:carbon-nitrogen hydrolase family protein n=1 Tax=unclassified Ruegeria TaxID=2625375 RepID=UPI001ADB533D|nr:MULTISPECIES: carbon-nitrogen hydrolase family protein [unclassified Ruegeria]MBO9412611.1 carbon-nitrogen hydrolase family protein [Ruegeria sp. R8_1]MBO9416151.1 carbon-nitrogen hydrolase family protein [Ruegeria sp. R8_2]
MKVAAVQAAPVFLDPQASTDKLIALLRDAASNGAELVVFPEVFLSGYPVWLRAQTVAHNDELLKIGHVAYLKSAITTDGSEIAAICAEATDLGVAVMTGIVERAGSGGSVYASLVTILPDKGVVNVHRKLKPTFHERLLWADGDGHGLAVQDWKGIRVGGLNCYENWQPLARQALYQQGEQLHIATWPGDLDVTDHITQFIAMEGRVYVVSVSGLLRSSDIPDSFPLRKHVTEGRDVINDGGSMIAAPGGKLIAGPVTGEEITLYAEIDVDQVFAAHLKLDPAGHYSRRDILSLNHSKQRLD